MRKIAFVIIGLIILIVACKHDIQDPIAQSPLPIKPPSDSTVNPTNDSVCFNTQIQPLFNSSCAMSDCHDPLTAAEGYDLTTYDGIKVGIVSGDPTNGIIMKEINRNNMPDYPIPPLTAAQKALLVKWINEGATNKQCVDVCNPSNATFTVGVFPIISANCSGCHNNSLPSGGVNLSSYDLIKTSVTSGKLLCSIEQGAGCSSMPKNTNKLDANCITLIKNWINNGALNN